MNNGELIGKVHSAMYHQCQNRGYAAPAAEKISLNHWMLPNKILSWGGGSIL